MNFVSFKGKSISKLCLGTVQFGLDYGINNSFGKPRQEEVDSIIEYLLNTRLNVFDTSMHYGDSQKVLGKAFSKYEHKPFVISKISSNLFEQNLEEELEQSLHDLSCKALLSLLLHDTKKLNSWDIKDTKRIELLKKEKKIEYFGVSIYHEEEFEKALDIDIIEFIQIPFNIFDLRALKLNWFEKAKNRGKQIFIRSIFLQGLLLMEKNKIPEKLKKIKPFKKEFENYSKEFSLSRAQFAMSFVNSVAKDAVLIFGCDNLQQAKENIAIYENLIKFSANDIQRFVKSFENIEEDLYLPTKW